DARSLQERHLVTVTGHHDAAQLALEPVRPAAVLFDQQHLLAAVEQVTGELIADPAAPDDDHVHPSALHDHVADLVRALDGGTQSVQAQAAIGLLALGIVDPANDLG